MGVDIRKDTGCLSDDELAFNLSQNSEYSTAEIGRVLSFFPDPKKYEEKVFQLSEALIRILSNDSESSSQLKKVVDPITNQLLNTRQLNETYMGHMTPQPIVPAIWGNAMAAFINANTIAREASYTESQLEPEAIGCLIGMVGYDQKKASGVFTSGGTEANQTALTLARLIVEKEAQEKNRPITKTNILASSYAHYSLNKSVRQLGGLNHDIKIKTVRSDDFKMSTSDLEEQLKTLRQKGESIMAIWAIAGETETGKVDNFQEISQLANKYGVLVIIDGAFGAPYKISKAGDKFVGMENAFAITIDPHKTFYQPYPSGASLIARVEDHALIGDIQHASYAGFSSGYQNILNDIRNNCGNLGQKRLSGSMGAQAILATLACIRSLGFEGYKIIYDLTINRINYLFDRLSKSNYLHPLYKPDINLLCFGLNKDIQKSLGIDNNDRLGEYINFSRMRLDNNIIGKGGYHFSTTDLPLDVNTSEWVFRACIMNPRTTNMTIDSAIGQLEENIKNDLKDKSK